MSIINIGFDIDSVVIDPYESIRRGLFDKWGCDFPFKEHTSYYFDIPEATSDEVNDEITKILIKSTPTDPAVPGAIYAIKRAFQICKTEIRFITARPIELFTVTQEWMKRRLDVPFSIHMTSFEPKNEVLESLKIDYFTDDRFKEAVGCHEVVEKMFLLNRPWNECRDLPLKSNIFRVNNLHDIIEHIK